MILGGKKVLNKCDYVLYTRFGTETAYFGTISSKIKLFTSNTQSLKDLLKHKLVTKDKIYEFVSLDNLCIEGDSDVGIT